MKKQDENWRDYPWRRTYLENQGQTQTRKKPSASVAEYVYGVLEGIICQLGIRATLDRGIWGSSNQLFLVYN